MAFFVTLLLFAAALVLSEVLKPKPENENVRPAALGDFTFPTTTEERVVPLIWGTVKMEGPNVIWYGDLKQKAIKEKVKTGLFSSDEITTGYEYYIGIQFGLCRGPVDNIRRIWIGDEEVWSGAQASGDIAISEPNLFGGSELGQGGVVGNFNFYNGSLVQSVNPYISAFQQEGGDTPAYRGTCYGVFKHGYIGNSTNIKAWSFELRRIPEGPGGLTKAVNDGNDANLAYVAYEIITNREWGLNFPPADVDEDAFNAAATTLQSEGNGFSFILDSARDISELLEEVQRQMDGVIFLDTSTGKWTIKLARNDYNPATIPVLSETNIVEVKDFTRGTWQDTTNYVTTPFKDRARDYFGTFGLAQDMANYNIQQKIVKSSINFPGVKDATLANSLAWRELRALSFPLAKATLIVNREMWELTPTSVLKWTSAALGFENLIMRVSRIDLGELINGRITLTLVQDVYATEPPSFGDPPASGWTPPSNVAVAIPSAESVVIEAPLAISIRDPDASTNSLPFRIWAAGRNQNDGSVEFDLRTRKDGGGSIYETERTIDKFLLIGELVGTLSEAVSDATIDVDPASDNVDEMLDEFQTVDDTILGNDLTHLILIDSEFILARSASDVGGNLRLANVYRGVLDSAITTHGASSKVYLLFAGGGIGNRSWANGNTIFSKLVTRTTDGELTEGDATIKTVVMNNRHLRPYPPIGFDCNGAGDYDTGPHSLDANGSLDAAGIEVTFKRRDYLEYQENIRQVNDNDAAPSEASTEYRIKVWNMSGTPTVLYTEDYNGGGNTVFIERTRVLRYNAGVIPSSLRGDIQTKHTLSAVDYTALQDAIFEFDVSSTELSGDFNFGVLAASAVSPAWTAPDTGSYSLDIGTAFTSGTIRARINGGSWQDIITAGNTNGSLTGVTAGDTIEVYATGVNFGGVRNETILIVDSPVSSTDAYAIFRV